MTFPSIDHSLLSPSGRMSRRSRKAALKREHDRLFPADYWDQPKRDDRKQSLLLSARNLRELAARGMRPKAHIKAAEKLEAEAALL